MTITIGTRITHGVDKYEVKSLIKEGGFGKAYLAEHTPPTAPSRTVVIKVPADHVLANPIWLHKFEREARILANISHRNVVNIIAFMTFKNGGRALVQELVSGAFELGDYISMNPSSSASLLLQTLYALRAFHDMTSPSAVHRDLSPSNILVSDAGVVKVIDFGLAKEDPRLGTVLTVAGEWFGTPGCMSPEQIADSASVDHRTDLFAVGRSFAAALQKRHPAAARPDKLLEPWKTICEKLTEDAPDDRPTSAADALSQAMLCFAMAGTIVEKFELHVEEMKMMPAAVGWPELCESHLFALPDYNQNDISTMSKINGSVFASTFDANAFFDRLEKSTAISNFDNDMVSFGDGDSLGVLYKNLYPSLDAGRRLMCFDRICRTAVSLHRYSVMGNIRTAYAAEPDASVRQQLMQILDTRDPSKNVHGHGVLPRVP